MKQTFKLTKEEFIKRSMTGDVFELNGEKYYYDSNENNPFRANDMSLNGYWYYFDGINEFTLVEPEPETESWAQFRAWSGKHWVASELLFKTLEDCIELYDSYQHHHEIPGTRIELPKVV